jgi:formylglycine-generating enzyme required for sulfatase activity
MSESQEPKPKKEPRIAGQPLPRLWKSESDPPEEDEEAGTKVAGEKALHDDDTASSKSSPKLQSKSGKANKRKGTKSKEPSHEGGKPGKKTLLEETPALDTLESRQRARWIMGGLTVFCTFLMGWISHRVFLYDPSPIDIPYEDPGPGMGSPEPLPSLDYQARFMYNRAHEFAKNGQTDQALAMLTKVSQVYKGTPTAAEAKAALERPQRNLPLFADGPLVVAEKKALESPTGPAQSPSPSSDVMRPSPPPSAAPGSVAATGPQPAAPIVPGQAAVVFPAHSADPAPAPSTLANAEIAKAVVTPRSTTPRALPPGFTAKIEAGLHESGWPLVIVGDRDGAPMVLVPGSTFLMGSDRGETAESPAHTVRVSTYYIDRHEVTNRQFRIFLDETHYHGQPPGKWLSGDKSGSPTESVPVVLVNYRDAEAFAIWAGKRLPTEAQWELAARSSDGRRYPWGDQPPKWSRPRVFRQVDPVMSFPEDVSPYGVYDLVGNALEWTRDRFDPKYFGKLKEGVTENPTGPTKVPNPLLRVVKGGSKDWIATFREGIQLDRRLPYLGFRCTLAVEGPDAPALITPHTGDPAPSQPGANPPGGNPPPGDVPF